MRVVVFVGGKGVRLRPLTEKLPKPLLPVGSKPILQTIVERLRGQGLTNICLATGYKADLIESYFADGQEMGVNISYTREPRPLGTAGALRLARDGYEGPLLVMNGDLLTEVSFKAMRAFHEQQNADITLAVKQRTMPVRFGVVDVSNGEVTGFREKPVLGLDVYAGIAILEPWVVELIPSNTRYDVPDLIDDVKQAGGTIRPYRMTEFWLDIGEAADYARANERVGEVAVMAQQGTPADAACVGAASQPMIPLSKPYFDEREVDAAARAIRSGMVGGGGTCGRRLEQEMAERLDVRHALLTTSCTSAMEAALMACGVGPGDEVICPSFTFTTTATSIIQRGATPVFVDIEPDTYNIDPIEIAKAIGPRVKAIMPVHYAGHACDMRPIMALAGEHGLFVIEDAAHAVGGSCGGEQLGTVGHIGCLSFHETKNLVCGEGGALLTDDDVLAEKLETIREKGTNRTAFLRGEVHKYTWVSAGSSYVLSDLLAALALEQFHKLDEITAARTAIAERYLAALRDVDAVVLPAVKPYARPNWHIFAIRVPEGTRDAVIGALRREGVGAAFHYVPLHSSPFGRQAGRQVGDLAVTDLVARTLIRLPLYPGMTADQVSHVLRAVRTAAAQPAAAPA